MKRWLLVVLLSLSTGIFANIDPDTGLPYNLIYISIDGLSRNTLYALIKKNKLPGLSKIIERGGYRNVAITTHPSNSKAGYLELLTGYYEDFLIGEDKLIHPLPAKITIWERMKDQFPYLNTGIIFSSVEKPNSRFRLKNLFQSSMKSVDIVYPETARTADQTKMDVLRYLSKAKEPFFLFFNITDVEKIGHQSREGSEYYSEALLEADSVIVELFNELNRRGIWQYTHVVVTTPYPFQKRSRNTLNQTESWVISTFKLPYKGEQGSLVPSILKVYGLDVKKVVPRFSAGLMVY